MPSLSTSAFKAMKSLVGVILNNSLTHYSLKQICHDLIYESVEMKTLIVFSLVFASNTILSCFFLFFFMIDLTFLI